MSKINHSAKSKLSGIEVPQEIPQTMIKIPEKILVTEKKPRHIHSFAMRSNDQERLQSLVKVVQSVSQKKITPTDVMRGLLILGEETDAQVLLNSVNKTFLE